MSSRKRPWLAPDYLEAPVTCVAWSRDSKTLLCGSASMTWVLACIDTDSGTVLRFYDFGRMAGDPYPVTLQYHPTCPKDACIALSDGSVLRLNTLTGNETYYYATEERCKRLKLDSIPKSTKSTVSDDNDTTNKNKPTIHENIRAMTVSPDGMCVFVGIGSTIKVYHAFSFQVLLSHNIVETNGIKKRGSITNINSLTLDATGQLLVANVSSRYLRVFGIIVEKNQQDQQNQQTIHDAIPTRVTLVWTGVDLYDAVNRDRRLGTPLIVNNESTSCCIVAGEINHHNIFIWEASSGNLLKAVSSHWPTVQKHLGVVSLASHPSRIFLASCAMDGTICFWCPPTKQDWSCKMLEYVNLDKNIVIDDDDDDDDDDDEEKSNNFPDGQQNDFVKVKQKRKRKITQDEKEKSIIVDVMTRKSTERLFFLRSDPQMERR
jgi:WD40 repeat protein